MHGSGKLIHRNNEFYEGEFFEDKATGFGKYINQHGEKYEGYFVNDKPHGQGI